MYIVLILGTANETFLFFFRIYNKPKPINYEKLKMILKKIIKWLFFFAVLSFSVYAQNDNAKQKVYNDNLPFFNKIVVSGNIDLFLDQQNFQEVKILTKTNIDKVLIYVRNSTLYIVSKQYQSTNIYVSFTNLIYLEAVRNSKMEIVKNAELNNLIVKTDYNSIINLYVDSKSMSIIALGSGIINLSGNIHYLKLQAKDAVQFNASLFSFLVDASLYNFADIELKGITDELNVRMKDDSFLKAIGIQTHNCTIEGDNFSEASVYVIDTLTFEGKKSASLFFKGEPKVLNKITSKRAEIYTTYKNKTKYALK